MPNVQLPRPVSDGLMQVSPQDGAIVLLAGRHRESGRLVFPPPVDSAYASEPLPPRGVLWSFTVQRFRPKSPPYAGPAAFEPYAVGYVDLGPLIVEGRLTGCAFDDLRIGMAMQVVPLVLELGDPPRAATTYAFAPEEGGAA